MLVHFAQSRNGPEVRAVFAPRDAAGIAAGRTDIGDAVALDDDLLVVEPGAGGDIEQMPDPQRHVGRRLAQGHQRQVLAERDFGLGIDHPVTPETEDGLGPAKQTERMRPVSGPTAWKPWSMAPSK